MPLEVGLDRGVMVVQTKTSVNFVLSDSNLV
jgi:hypothetical protein